MCFVFAFWSLLIMRPCFRVLSLSSTCSFLLTCHHILPLFSCPVPCLLGARHDWFLFPLCFSVMLCHIVIPITLLILIYTSPCCVSYSLVLSVSSAILTLVCFCRMTPGILRYLCMLLLYMSRGCPGLLCRTTLSVFGVSCCLLLDDVPPGTI